VTASVTEKPLPASTSKDWVISERALAGSGMAVPETHLPSVVLEKPVKAKAVLPETVARAAEVAAKTGLSVTETFHMAE